MTVRSGSIHGRRPSRCVSARCVEELRENGGHPGGEQERPAGHADAPAVLGQLVAFRPEYHDEPTRMSERTRQPRLREPPPVPSVPTERLDAVQTQREDHADPEAGRREQREADRSEQVGLDRPC